MRLLPLTIGTSIKTNLIIDKQGKIVGYANEEKNMKHLRIVATDEYELCKFNMMFSTDYQNYMFVNPNRVLEVDNDGTKDLENAIYKYNMLRGDTTIKLKEDKK